MDIRKKLAAAWDAQIMGTLTNSAPQPPQEPLTLAKLQKLMASLPKRETWLSTRLCASPNAFTVEGGSERFTVAHPMFWARVEDWFRKNAETRPATGNLLGFNLTPIEIDPWPEDSPETAAWRADHWRRLREAVDVAMIPLPDWLQSAPKFGKHG